MDSLSGLFAKYCRAHYEKQKFMRTKVYVLCLFCSVLVLWLNAQTSVNVVHLKNGSVLKGAILEQIPSESLKLRLCDGSVFVFKTKEIEKITLEETIMNEKKEVKLVDSLKNKTIVPDDKVVEKAIVVTNTKPLVYKSNAIYQNNMKLTPAQISSVLAKSPAALESFKKAEGFETVSRISDLSFWVFAGVGVLFAIQKKPNSALALPVVGMGTSFVSKIAFSTAARNKIKHSVEVYNVDLKSSSQLMFKDVTVGMADTGLGFKLRF